MTTALGPVQIHRPYLWRPADGGLFPADALLGIDGFLTRQARRVITLVGVEHSFARGQRMLAELCGWQVDDDVIRRTTHAEAQRTAEGRPERPDGATFAAAEGASEVLIDAGKVNTLTGWRDVKVGLFLKREAGSGERGHGGRVGPARPARSHGAGGDRGDRRGGGVRATPSPGVGPVGGDDRIPSDGVGRRGRVDLERGGGPPAAGVGGAGHLPPVGTPG